MTLRLQTTTIFHGPSIWSQTPVICVELGAEPREPEVASEVRVALLEALGRIEPDSGPAPGGGQWDAPGSASPVEWAGWLSVALQRLCAIPVERSFHRPSHFAFEFLHERVGKAAAHLALRFLNHQLVGSESAFDLEFEINRLDNLNRAYDHGPTGRAFAAAARRRGIPLSTVDPRGRIVELGNGRCRQRILGTMTSHTAALSNIISNDKLLTNRFLEEAGFPVPVAAPARDIDQAIERAARIGYPVVLKPLDQADSYLVIVDIRDEAELRTRFETIERELHRQNSYLLVEQFIRGNVYRALVVDNQVVAVFQRIVAHVIGDGRHSIEELIQAENARPERASFELRPIVVDDETLLVLERQGCGLSSIPASGQRIELKPQIGHKRDGGAARDCTGELHPENAALLVQATGTIGLDVAGIDFVTPDLTQPMLAAGGAIIEINASPDFQRHLRPSIGNARDPTSAVLDILFPPGAPVRVPVVAVTGAASRTQLTRMIAKLLAARGQSVGIAAGLSVEAGGLRLRSTGSSNYQGARQVLNSRAIDFAVLETPPDEIVAFGLPVDRCDVAVVTSCSNASPAGFPSAESVLCQTVLPGGILVLNGDDPAVVALGRHAEAQVLLYSLDPGSKPVAAHLRQGGRVVVMRPGSDKSELALLNPNEPEEILAELSGFAGSGASASDRSAQITAAAAAIVALGIPFESFGLVLQDSLARAMQE